MRSSGGKRLNHPKKVLCCNVTFLDDAVATYEIPKDAKGSILFQSVVRSLDLDTEASYFGLLFTDYDNFHVWLDLDKKIKSQVKSEAPYQFQFRVKYYVSEPGAMLLQELTRYQYVLQIKQDLFHQRLSCTFRTLALLASFIVQSELGDYDRVAHKPGYLREFKFVPNQPTDLEAEIAELHKMHTGLTPEEVEVRYLEKAKWLTAYGVDMRQVKDSHGLQLTLGIAPSGIQIYHGDNAQSTFEWPRITKLRFHQKKLFVKVQPKEPGSKEQEHCFIVGKTKHCKLLWKICLEHHGFYKRLPPIDRTATLLRTTSQKSHRNGTTSRANIRSDSFRDSYHTPCTPNRNSHPDPTTPHRNSRPEPTTPSRMRHTPRQEPRQDPRQEPRHDHYTSRHENAARQDYATRHENAARQDYASRHENAYYNSLPRKRHDFPEYHDTNRYDKTMYEKNISSYNGTLTKRSKSIGASDVLDLDYPQKHAHANYRTNADYRNNDYYNSGEFKSFFTDTVLQNKMQYNSNYGKSWANNVNYQQQSGVPRPGSKSTPDVRLAASQPAFMTSSAMRQANFLMTTEL